MKDLIFLVNSLDELRNFPPSVKNELVYSLHLIQNGGRAVDEKPFKTVGQGVNEVRVKDENGAFRVMYVAKFLEAVYVLHAFQKKTQKTARSDIEIAKQRYQWLISSRKETK
ncbi:MAG: type II toxin-antitoxin system RelE/ParE family toxin [Neisseriaceae bacterium]|nr:type II toxin-antitoxin system RelE/ParE family toxin [Neisseriaceae bacterium]